MTDAYSVEITILNLEGSHQVSAKQVHRHC